MGRDDTHQLIAAKRAYKEAAAVGNCHEEARWANVIGDIHKNRGEYVEALKWLRIDYEISIKYLPEKHLFPTCQSLGEVHLRLQQFHEALSHQKRHLDLAKDADDLVEQQRACTQLGRTYHEMFLKSDDDHSAVRNAKKYFKSAMKLACTIKASTSLNKSSHFIKEYIDAHNNLGMLEMDLDNLEEAQRILLEGIKICDEEEVIENDAVRSRLHHNLGSVYMEKRMWDQAREHIERDILICKRIGHCQGEAKGYINLGDLHYRVHKYEEALRCYKKALDIAKSMEDEDALVDTINQNIKTIKDAAKVMDDLKKEDQNLKKLTRTMATARGTPSERKYLLQLNTSLDCLIEKSRVIYAWLKHRDYSKRKKRVAKELCDKEKLSDSFLVIGEAYQKLRNFSKSLKWYTKSWDIYKSIGNLEGQALAKINIGDVLDSYGDWTGALEAFKEGYRIAVEANLPSVQISALENIHYSHMIRFDNVEEARKSRQRVEDLKCSRDAVLEAQNRAKDCCSETETEGDDDLSADNTHTYNSPKLNESAKKRSKLCNNFEQFEDDAPLSSLLKSNKTSSKSKAPQPVKASKVDKPTDFYLKGLSKLSETQFPQSSRKRVRVVLSDDESDGSDELDIPRTRTCPPEDVATSCEFRKTDGSTGFSDQIQDDSHFVASKDMFNACTPINLEESSCSYKSRSPKVATDSRTRLRSSSVREADNTSNIAASGSKTDGNHASDNLVQNQNSASYNERTDDEYSHLITFKVDDKLVPIDLRSCTSNDELNIESMKVEVACLYYLQLSKEQRLKGLLPVVRSMKCDGKSLGPRETVESLKDIIAGKRWIEVDIDGWVQKRFMKSYIDSCRKLRDEPNVKLLKKLYNLEVSEDEVIVSGCELQDISITPLLDALREHKTIAMLDLSHNMLGNETMEKLQQIFMSSTQKYGGLTLDLHQNRLGPTALFQICECPVLFTRLEVLNISGNRLTDACGSYLSTIIQNCKALYSLNLECCAITSRTIQKVADAIDSGSMLAQLSIGHNNPVTGNVIVNLLSKLATLKSFSELNLKGIKLNKPVVDRLCQLARVSCLSGLMLGNTNIGVEGVLELTKALSAGAQELVKLDLSYCGLMPQSSVRLCADINSIGGILELNLGGNSIGQEGVSALASLLMDSQCCLKVLTLNKCRLGLAGVTRIIQALADNGTVEELNLAENADMIKENISKFDVTQDVSSKPLERNLLPDPTDKCAPNEAPRNDLCVANTECKDLEVADSEEGPIKGEHNLSSLEDSCTSSCRRNTASQDNQLIEELSTAIIKAKQLQLLDLSSNWFTPDITETLYIAWSSCSRTEVLCKKHVEEKMVHFSVDGKKCCGVKACCKRDS